MTQAAVLNRYQHIHVFIFFLGALLFAVSATVSSREALVAAGICIAISGAMTIVGNRITFAGTLGTSLRGVIGGAGVVYPRIVGTLWVLIGLSMATLGGYWIVSGTYPDAPPVAPVQIDPGEI